MLTLYSYPGLFGVADNNMYGLKVFAFLKLARLPFRHEHVVDASAAPRNQLPYIDDEGVIVGDSDAIIAHLVAKHGVPIDRGRTQAQRTTDLLVRRALDDLYWVMSYSRWRDETFWPHFRDAFLSEHPRLTADDLEAAKTYNAQRYHFQGIGRFEPPAVYARGIATLQALADLVPDAGFLFGPEPASVDAALYGSIANIHFFEIETPLRQFVAAQPGLVRHCATLYTLIAQIQH
jgi:glutathione S-transferase